MEEMIPEAIPEIFVLDDNIKVSNNKGTIKLSRPMSNHINEWKIFGMKILKSEKYLAEFGAEYGNITFKDILIDNDFNFISKKEAYYNLDKIPFNLVFDTYQRIINGDVEMDQADVSLLALKVYGAMFENSKEFEVIEMGLSNLRKVETDKYTFLEQNPNKMKDGQYTAYALMAQRGEKIMWVIENVKGSSQGKFICRVRGGCVESI
jgi:hypothetical protein